MKSFGLTRREALKQMGALGAGTLLAAWGLPVYGNRAHRGQRIVVVGGGFGGATAAKYLKRLSPGIDVVLVEPQNRYYTCPFTNLYLGGLRKFESLGHDYRELASLGVRIVSQTAVDVDPENRRLRLADGGQLSWDRLILSPGIDIRWDELEGYGREAADRAPHAWKPGPQSRLLRQQLREMPDGGTFILSAPDNPFRCPPGPYERVSMVAHYFKTHKPRSKVLLLDAKDNFSKQGLFLEGWKEHYGDMIEWVGRSNDGKVIRVDAGKLEVETEFGEIHRAAVLNVVPPQKAGFIADRAGVTDESGWVPIKPKTFESKKIPGVYVIGDATQAAPMPKSGFVANTQAKVTASAILADLAGEEPPEPTWTNTCYSVIAPGWGITVAGVYEVHEEELREVPGSGGVSPLGADTGFRRREAAYAEAWYAAIAQDTWGTL